MIRLALLSDGTTLPITKLYDADGEETDDPDLAVTFEAEDERNWLTGHCAEFPEITLH